MHSFRPDAPLPADGSGAIDREELVPLLRELGIPISVNSELLHGIDVDGTGDVRREELAKWLHEVTFASILRMWCSR